MEASLIVDYSVRLLCATPYPNHPNGCPNFGKKGSCPPKVKRIYQLIDENKSIFVAFNVFDFGGHVSHMKERHPKWSKRQLANCLYWQGTARKQLRLRVNSFISSNSLLPIYCPEACGVNVTATMKNIGEILEWPPKTKAYQVAVLGHPIKRWKVKM